MCFFFEWLSATEDESGTERVKRGRNNQQWQPEDFVILILKVILNLTFKNFDFLGPKGKCDITWAYLSL